MGDPKTRVEVSADFSAEDERVIILSSVNEIQVARALESCSHSEPRGMNCLGFVGLVFFFITSHKLNEYRFYLTHRFS